MADFIIKVCLFCWKVWVRSEGRSHWVSEKT